MVGGRGKGEEELGVAEENRKNLLVMTLRVRGPGHSCTRTAVLWNLPQTNLEYWWSRLTGRTSWTMPEVFGDHFDPSKARRFQKPEGNTEIVVACANCGATRAGDAGVGALRSGSSQQCMHRTIGDRDSCCTYNSPRPRPAPPGLPCENRRSL